MANCANFKHCIWSSPYNILDALVSVGGIYGYLIVKGVTWLHLKIGHQDSSASYARQGDKTYKCWQWMYKKTKCIVIFFIILCLILLIHMCVLHRQTGMILPHQWLTHWGRDKMDAISQTPFSNAFSWMKMFEYRLKFHWSLFLRVQLTISQHWFR